MNLGTKLRSTRRLNRWWTNKDSVKFLPGWTASAQDHRRSFLWVIWIRSATCRWLRHQKFVGRTILKAERHRSRQKEIASGHRNTKLPWRSAEPLIRQVLRPALKWIVQESQPRSEMRSADRRPSFLVQENTTPGATLRFKLIEKNSPVWICIRLSIVKSVHRRMGYDQR